jgi:Na+-transporting methylmalonyl-CoA/oxaloacetate decarboxylase beta subunit
VHLAGVCRYGALQVALRECVLRVPQYLALSLSPLLFLSLSISAIFSSSRTAMCQGFAAHRSSARFFSSQEKNQEKLNKPLLFCFSLFCFHSFSELLCRARSFALGALLSFLIVFFFFFVASFIS